jgi:hypothetical protein
VPYQSVRLGEFIEVIGSRDREAVNETAEVLNAATVVAGSRRRAAVTDGALAKAEDQSPMHYYED